MMMNIHKYRSGAVFEVPLFGDFGFGYVKVIHYGSVHWQNSVIKPLNFFRMEQLKNGVDALLGVQYAFAPYILLGDIKVRGKNSWRYVGDLPSDEDHFPPKFKRCHRSFGDVDDLRKLQWDVVHNLDPTDKRNYNDDLEKIKGLGIYEHSNDFSIKLSITAAWMLEKGINPFDYLLDHKISMPHGWDECVYYENLRREDGNEKEKEIFSKYRKPVIPEVDKSKLLFEEVPYFPCEVLKLSKGYMVKIKVLYSMFFHEEFAKLGLECNGYCWEGIIGQLLEKVCPELLHTIDFDSEADHFYAKCKDENIAKELASLIHRYFSCKEGFEDTMKSIDVTKLNC